MQILFDRPVIVETKPATEWLLGGPVQKVSPRYAHAALQLAFGSRLLAWSKGRGRVGSEWRFWVQPPHEYARYLVPDVAYLTYERLPRDAREAAQEPHVAPNVVVEIRSPGDRNIHIYHKLDVYLRAGTELVIMVDPQLRTCALHDAETERVLRDGDRLEHTALPEFSLDLAEFFATLDT